MTELKNMTLASLAESPAAELFNEAVAKVGRSLTEDDDIAGARTITLAISIAPGKRSLALTDISVVAKVPPRKYHTVALASGGKLQIDTVTHDVEQPGLDLSKIGPEGRENVGEGT